MLYYLLAKKKVNLPFVLFSHLKEAIRKSRNTMNQEKNVFSNIPFGCILTDIFVESGLVDFLTKEAKFSEYLISSVG